MNTTSLYPTAPPPPPPQPSRSSFSCDSHPAEQFTGFCPSCLCDRLTILDNSSSASIKSLFPSAPKANNLPPRPQLPKLSKTSSVIPELRRTKSFSASKNEALGLPFEPQRKSCDVRARNSLWTLFSLNEESISGINYNIPTSASTLASSSSNQNQQNSRKTESFVADKSKNKPVFEEIEIKEDFREHRNLEESIASVDDEVNEIRPVQDFHLECLRKSVELNLASGEILEDSFSLSNLKPMKDHMDLNSQGKKSSGGKIWAAASVFSKKWQNWRRKQKLKKQSNGQNQATLPVEKPIPRQYRETQSEIADYGFGRRSCDTDPRFSLDVARMSFDDARYSFEEPRASWDGHLIGRSFPRMAPMVSVMEVAPPLPVSRTDMQIPVEGPSKNFGDDDDDDDGVPGGSSQTREYYLDSSSSRRRKSLDRSSSVRKTAAAVVAEIDELKTASNAKITSTAADSFHGAKVLVDPNLNSKPLKDDLSETFELSGGLRDMNSVIGNGGETTESKRSKRWSWKIWGFIQRRSGGSKEDDDEDGKYSRANGVERSLSESWQETRRGGNGNMGGGFNRNMLRSNSSASWRNANHIEAPFASGRKSSVEMYGNGKKRNEFVLERNRSGRYSPKHIDNSLLRFYLTPLRGSQRGGMGKIKPTNSQPLARRSVMRLY